MSSATLCGDTMQDNRKFLDGVSSKKRYTHGQPLRELAESIFRKIKKCFKSMQVNAELE